MSAHRPFRQALLHNRSVRRLSVARCGAGCGGGGTGQRGCTAAAAAVVAMLAGNPTLVYLNLRENPLGDSAMKSILEAATSASQGRGGTGLSELDVGGTGAGRMSVTAAEALFASGRLTRVGFSGLQLPGGAWASHVLPAVSASASLVALDLSHNNCAPGAEVASAPRGQRHAAAAGCWPRPRG